MTLFTDKAKYDAGKFDKKLTRNLFQETEAIIKKHGKSKEEILWVGDVAGQIAMSYNEFERQTADFVYLPRGRCAFIVSKDDKPVSYFPDDDGKMNRVPPDLIISAETWMLRRFIHVRVVEEDKPRQNGALYDESPEYWEFIQLPVRQTPMLVDGANEIRLFATDNVSMARNLKTLNSEPGKGDPKFKRFEEFDRNKLRVTNGERKTMPKRKTGF